MSGDADLAAVGSLLADRARCQILLALADGRALAASTLADEAGVGASTASAHLSKLAGARLLHVETHGRHRYYRLAGPHVSELLETVARIAPAAPVRSLRQGTRAAANRAGRTCYDHLAGRLGVAVMAALLDNGVLDGGDGGFHRAAARDDRLSAPGRDVDYRLTDHGRARLADLGVDLPTGSRRPLVRYCVDWSEQRHHLGGALGAALLCRFLESGWVRRTHGSRAIRLTDVGRTEFARQLGVEAP